MAGPRPAHITPQDVVATVKAVDDDVRVTLGIGAWQYTALTPAQAESLAADLKACAATARKAKATRHVNRAFAIRCGLIPSEEC